MTLLCTRQDGRCDLNVALVGCGFSDKQDTWMAPRDVPGAIDAYLKEAAGLPVEADTANAMWRLLDQYYCSATAGAAEVHCELDVVYLAGESFARDRWTCYVKPLLLASEHLGARVRTVLAAVACSQSRRVAEDWSEGLNGELVELRDADFEAPQTDSTASGAKILTAMAASRVFGMATRWRGHMLIPARDAAGALAHVTCSVELDALTASGHGCAIDSLPADTVPHVDVAAGGTTLGKGARKASAATASHLTVPLAQGVKGRSSCLRLWKVVDGASIPMHLLAAGCLHMRMPELEGCENTSALRQLINHPRAAVIGCLETWKATESRAVDDLLGESADEREARRHRLQHALWHHDVSSGWAGAGDYHDYHLVRRRLVVLQRDAVSRDRVLVSAFRCEGSGALAQSFAPFLRSFFFAPQREASASTALPARGTGDARERNTAAHSDAGAVPKEVDVVDTVVKKRPLWDWSSEIPRRRQRARTACTDQPLATFAAAQACPRDQGDACFTGAALSGGVRGETEGGQAWHGTQAAGAMSLRDSLAAMTHAEIERLKADDKVRSGDSEDMTHKELPKPDLSTRRRSRKDKSKVRAPSGQGANDENSHAKKTFEKAKKFVAQVRKGLLDWSAAQEAASRPVSPAEDAGTCLYWANFSKKLQEMDSLELAQCRWAANDMHIEPQDMCRDEGGVQLARAAIAADTATEEVKEWGEQVLFKLKQLGRVVESACEGAGVSSTQAGGGAPAASVDDTFAFPGFGLCPVQCESFCMVDAPAPARVSPKKHTSKDDSRRARAPRPARAQGDAETKSSKALAKPLHADMPLHAISASSVALGPNGKNNEQGGAKGREADAMPALKRTRNASPMLGARGSDRHEASRASSWVKEPRQRDADKHGSAPSNAAAGGKDNGAVHKGKPGTAASIEPDPRLKKVLKSVLKKEIETVFGDSLSSGTKAYEDVRLIVFRKVQLQIAQGWDAQELAALNELELREQVTMLTRNFCKIHKRLTHQPAPQ